MLIPYPAHSWISTVCPILSVSSLGIGAVLLVIDFLGYRWANRPLNICGFGVLLPLVTGIALLYGKHWEFRAFAPVAAQSGDGHSYRDGCEMWQAELESIRAGEYPDYYYRWYAFLVAIVIVGELRERIMIKRARRKQAAKYAKTQYRV